MLDIEIDAPADVDAVTSVFGRTGVVVAAEADYTVGQAGDVDTAGATLNKVLKWNGSNWVPGTAGDTTEFEFGIASFTDNQDVTQLIGTGVWKAAAALTFDATYDNGPPDSAYIALTSDGGVSWGSNLTLTTPFLTVDSTEDTDYPNAKDKYIRCTLTATKGAEVPTDSETVYFRNLIYWGEATKNAGFTEADVEALANSSISNDQTKSMVLTPAANEYLVFAFPSSYTSIPHGDDYEEDGNTGFKYNSIACAFKAPETVSITNSAGFTEDYKVYASEELNLGSHTLVTTTAASTINPLYYGKTVKTDTFLEADIEALANSEITNDNTQVWDSVTTGVGEYMLFAFPKRLGTVTFWVSGFEGGFEAPETVSVTNANGWTEDYYVWRSTNSNLGATVVETT